MAPILHCTDMSPPVRGVLMTAKALDVDLDLREINLLEKEHLTPEFLKMNPQHSVPTLEDDDFILWDSHAIAAYLVNKYSQDDALYPQDPNLRAVVDQRLHFNGGLLQPRVGAIIRGIAFEGFKSIPEDQLEKVLEAYGFLETFLEDKEWLAGDNMTIADLCTVASISSINTVVHIDSEEFPKLSAWLERCTELSCYQEANVPGLEKLEAALKMKLET